MGRRARDLRRNRAPRGAGARGGARAVVEGVPRARGVRGGVRVHRCRRADQERTGEERTEQGGHGVPDTCAEEGGSRGVAGHGGGSLLRGTRWSVAAYPGGVSPRLPLPWLPGTREILVAVAPGHEYPLSAVRPPVVPRSCRPRGTGCPVPRMWRVRPCRRGPVVRATGGVARVPTGRRAGARANGCRSRGCARRTAHRGRPRRSASCRPVRGRTGSPRCAPCR